MPPGMLMPCVEPLGMLMPCVDLSADYARLAQQDEDTAVMLRQVHNYRASMYLLLQAMEKYIASVLARYVDYHDFDSRTKYFTHAIEDMVNGLLNLNESIKDPRVRVAIRDQAKLFLFIPGVEFKKLHNALRYPFLHDRRLVCLDIGERDVDMLFKKLVFLKSFLTAFQSHLPVPRSIKEASGTGCDTPL